MVVVFSKGNQCRDRLGWLQETCLRHRCWTQLFLPECPVMGPLLLNDCERDQGYSASHLPYLS